MPFSGSRPNVLVQAEQVGWVILRLHPRQAVVVLSIGGADPVFAFLAEIIHVDTPCGEWSHGFKDAAYPGHVAPILGGVVRNRAGDEVPVGFAVAVGRTPGLSAGRLTACLLQDDEAGWPRHLGELADHGVDGGV